QLAYLAPLPQPSPAIDGLLRDARQHWAAGRHEQAAAGYERALRIEPRNAHLWQHLAALRLDQGKPQLAEQFAAKSNSFAGDSATLRQRNWRIIAAARRAGGDPRGAREADAQAARYEAGGR
ncbi:MAG TPA: tetratricopeptide repeat protein, partial [Gammaproteobacteria bacterium]